MMEAWVWRALYFRIFDSHSTFWAGDIGKDFYSACYQIPERINKDNHDDALLAEFHNCRARSTNFITKLSFDYDAPAKEIASDIAYAISALRLYFPNPPAELSLSVFDDALEIVEDAAALDLIFRTSEAHFSVFYNVFDKRAGQISEPDTF
ncbi:hypothetical protein B0T22DRAFT_511706 [Podospora appendiculata]|uniref:Uncharacterized protein n=1 Tax=Podospora appendiculata TaxID=314037 RepID=A0AAE1CCA4_9PEZI|nr:hypothetical protein B0T22DRAFT_511706 [Podospora appendiculata]